MPASFTASLWVPMEPPGSCPSPLKKPSRSPNNMNIHFFSILIGYIEAGAAHGGYVFLFAISVLEAVPLVGTSIPGHTAVIISGFLARIGLFNIWAVLILASLGAICGDMLAFYLGRKYGMQLINRFKPYFFFKDETVEKNRRLL